MGESLFIIKFLAPAFLLTERRSGAEFLFASLFDFFEQLNGVHVFFDT